MTENIMWKKEEETEDGKRHRGKELNKEAMTENIMWKRRRKTSGKYEQGAS